ncbi:hypothetical protein HGRIS_008187 [Hohenbuehelia grisea]|uniref:Uncharacterized protein n=1 Tax=Hohenbuehelia grisea TaxID=104357 RepID=A0ABR3J7E3_9AGAR
MSVTVQFADELPVPNRGNTQRPYIAYPRVAQQKGRAMRQKFFDLNWPWPFLSSASSKDGGNKRVSSGAEKDARDASNGLLRKEATAPAQNVCGTHAGDSKASATSTSVVGHQNMPRERDANECQVRPRMKRPNFNVYRRASSFLQPPPTCSPVAEDSSSDSPYGSSEESDSSSIE